MATKRTLATPHCLQPASKQTLGGTIFEHFCLIANPAI
jgi:hypothetical protein